VMSGWENGRGLPVVCPPQSFLSQKADGQREISWLFRGFGDTANEDKNIFKEDPDKELPWDIAFRSSNTIELKNDIFYFVPKPSLLLLYKLKAMRDRIYDLREAQSLEQRRYLEGKTFKDKADSIALLDPRNRYRVVRNEFYQFADKHKVSGLMKDSLRIIYEDVEAMRFYGADVSSVKAWLEKLL